MLINKSAIQKLLKTRVSRVSKDFFVLLDKQVDDLLKKAVEKKEVAKDKVLNSEHLI